MAKKKWWKRIGTAIITGGASEVAYAVADDDKVDEFISNVAQAANPINIGKGIVEAVKDGDLKTLGLTIGGALLGIPPSATLVTLGTYNSIKNAFSDEDDTPKVTNWNDMTLEQKIETLNNKVKNFYIEYKVNDEDKDVTENVLIIETKAIGFMDYKNNKIVNENGVDIDHIRYEGLSPFQLENAYLVLDNNSINFENE